MNDDQFTEARVAAEMDNHGTRYAVIFILCVFALGVALGIYAGQSTCLH